MDPVVIVENDPLLPGAGWIGRVLERRGIPFEVVEAHAGGIAAVDTGALSGLVVLGGRQHAWEEAEHPYLAAEREAMARCATDGTPVLGCCLGGQVLARALGGAVTSAAEGEYGWLPVAATGQGHDDPLFRHGGPGDEVYLWHVDEFALPPGAVHLASSGPGHVQAFRLGSAWGVQFHPEVDLAVFDRWHENFPDACATVGLDAAAMRTTAVRREHDPELFAVRMLDGFASVVLA